MNHLLISQTEPSFQARLVLVLLVFALGVRIVRGQDKSADPFGLESQQGGRASLGLQSSDVTLAPVVSARPESSQVLDSVKLLRQVREESFRDLRVGKASVAVPSINGSDPTVGLSDLQSELARQQNEEAAWEDRIKSQLGRLQRLIQNGEACRPARGQGLEPEAVPVPPELGSESMSEMESNLDSELPPKDELESRREASPPNNESSSFSEQPADATPSGRLTAAQRSTLDSIVQAYAVVDGPVDRLGLANNLYATGEHELALEIYQKMVRDKGDSFDSLWVQYQIANCFRQLGNRAESERMLRIIIGQKKDSWITRSARWWLETNETSAELQRRLERWNVSLDQLREPEDETASTR